MVHWLKFSSIEKHFYQKQKQECESEAVRLLAKNCAATIDVQRLMAPLLRLRHACCHPQVGQRIHRGQVWNILVKCMIEQ